MDKFIPIFSGATLLFGLFILIGGIRIIRDKKYLFVSRHTSPEKWQKPRLHTGRGAVYHGIGYIFGGILFIIVSLVVLIAGE